jgi:hypothetical protein
MGDDNSIIGVDMRPISTDEMSAQYRTVQELARDTVMRSYDDDAPAKRRKIAEEKTVENISRELEDLIANHWNNRLKGKWDSKADEGKAKRLRLDIGAGYINATRSLIAQTGQYCAYCNTPVFSDLQAQPVLPADWFPRQAFDYDKMLPACPSCREIKKDSPGRNWGYVSQLLDPAVYAWPHLYWKNSVNGAVLPFRIDLVELLEPSFIASNIRQISDSEIAYLIRLYRMGRISVLRSESFGNGRVVVNMPDGKIRPIAAWISPKMVDMQADAASDNLIKLLKLNEIGTVFMPNTLDRRLELRTMAYLKALDLRERLSCANESGDERLYARFIELLRHTVRTTGFWGVWLSVFKNVPDIQQFLRTIFPGTSNVLWKVI